MSQYPSDPEGSHSTIIENDPPETYAEAESSTSAQNPSRSTIRRRPTTEWYLRHLESHISQSRSHVQGNADLPAAREFHWATTVVAPLNTAWDPTIKARFFASLTRHSKLRPDLIALDLHRTEGEIRAYLDLLEDGAFALKRSQGGDGGYRDRSSRWGGATYSWLKGFAPEAREASGEWVEAEEEAAIEVDEMARQRTEDSERISAEAAKKERLKSERLAIGVGRGKRTTKAQRDVLDELGSKLDLEAQRRKWLTSIDTDTLSALNRTLDQPNKAVDSVPGQTLNTVTVARKKYSKDARIILDNKAIDFITTIPPGQRTAKHKSALTTMCNRKKMRERKRVKKLSAQGLGEEEIALLGGVDAVHDAEKGLGVDLGEMTGEGWFKLQFGGDVEEQAEADEAGRINMESDEVLYLTETVADAGWNIFNLDKMNELLSAERPNDTAAVSAEYVTLLRDRLTGFLAPLILHAIIIAEQGSAQYDDKPPGSISSVAETEIDDQSCFTRYHVDMALSLRGGEITVAAPAEIIQMDDTEGEDGDPSPVNDGANLASETITQDGNRYGPHAAKVAPPGQVAWHVMDLKSHSSLRLAEEDDKVGIFTTTESKEDVAWEVNSTLTDEEDETLENYMDAMDQTTDREAERRLWTGEAEAGEEKTADLQDPAVEKARQKYETEYFRIMKARRWRRAVKRRSVNFPTTRLRNDAAAARGKKSDMRVLDDDENLMDLESGEEDEGRSTEQQQRKRKRAMDDSRYDKRRRVEGSEDGEASELREGAAEAIALVSDKDEEDDDNETDHEDDPDDGHGDVSD